jgi:hypothetical protein
MATSKRSVRLQLEPLEGRALLSGMTAHVPATVAALATTTHPILLFGSVRGTFRPLGPVNVSKLPPYVFGGVGALSPVGLARVSGVANVQALLANSASAHLDLILAGKSGAVVISIVRGTAAVDLSKMPLHLRFIVRGGTGAFRNVTGTGAADVAIPGGLSSHLSGGSFLLVLRPDLPKK